MKKYRILVRAFTARRDVMTFKVIEKILETFGCEVIVSSLRSFDLFVKLWKPHAIIFNTQGESLHLKKQSPESKIIFVPGEGMEIGAPYSIPSLYNTFEPEYLESTDLIFLWSHYSNNECKEKIKNYSHEKFIVSGNPKLDLVKFNKLKKRKNKIKCVGISCRFSTINHHEGIPVLRPLLPGKPLANNIVFSQIFSFHSMMEIIEKILVETKLKVSLRPHPNEAVEPYFEYVIPHFKKYEDRININYSLCLVEWLKEIDIMLTTTSTSIYEAALINVPIICIDKLSPSAVYAVKEAVQSREFLDSLNTPNSLKKLFDILTNKVSLKHNTKTVMKQLKNFHDWPRDYSSCLKIAKEVINFLNKQNFSRNLYVPRFLLMLFDKIKFYRAIKKNRLHWNFNYIESSYKLPDDFTYIIEKILSQKD